MQLVDESVAARKRLRAQLEHHAREAAEVEKTVRVALPPPLPDRLPALFAPAWTRLDVTANLARLTAPGCTFCVLNGLRCHALQCFLGLLYFTPCWIASCFLLDRICFLAELYDAHPSLLCFPPAATAAAEHMNS